MTLYRLEDNPDECLYLHINREFNENIPPHERFAWTREIKIGSKIVSTPLRIRDIDDKENVFVFDTGDVVDLTRKTLNGRAIIAMTH